jgi:hypothetical protein
MSPMAKPMQARQAAVTTPGTIFWRFSCDISPRSIPQAQESA